MSTVLQISSMVPPAGFGGAERVVGWLTERLRDRGLSVHNAGLGSRHEATDADVLPIRNLYWPFDGRTRGPLARSAWHAVDAFLLPARAQVRRLFDEVAPSVVVTHNLRGWGLAPWVVAKERGVPLVQVVHDYGLVCSSATLWRGSSCEGLCGPCRWRARAALRRWPGGHVVGVSRAVLTTQSAYGITFDAPTSVVHPVAAAAAVRRRSVRVPEGRARTIGFMGRLSPAKGLELLLAAVAGLDVRLVVGGTGSPAYERVLRDAAPANVTWAGWQEPDALLAQVDLLVVPSTWSEPFGLVVVEAARAGVPVLMADQPGLVEAAQASQARFSTFRAGDVEGIRAGLERPLEDFDVQADEVGSADLVALIAEAARDEEPAPRRRGSHA